MIITSPKNKLECLVVGSAVVDILLFPENDRDEKSVPCRSKIDLGGVGYNMAGFLADFGHSVTLMTAVGSDLLASAMLERIKGLSVVAVQDSLIPESPIYVGINQAGSIRGYSDLNCLERLLTQERLAVELEQLKTSSFVPRMVVFDANLSSPVLAETLSQVRRLWPDAVICANSTSPEKVIRLSPCLNEFDYLFMNAQEFEVLFGRSPNSSYCLNSFKRTPKKAIVVTQGAAGVLSYVKDHCFEVAVSPLKCANTNRAGDYFASVVMNHLLPGEGLELSVATIQKAIQQTGEFLKKQNIN